MIQKLQKHILGRKKEIKYSKTEERQRMSKILEMAAGSLLVKAFDNREEMGRLAAEDAAARINRMIDDKGVVNAVFAAAPSQNEFLAELLKHDIDWTKIKAFHMDEYIGLSEDAPQGFGNFLREAIFSKVPFMEVNYLNGQADDPQAECIRYAALLEANPPDIVFLGIGENGHLAFNDPGVADFKDLQKVKVVSLDQTCRNQQVNDGCFAKFEDVPVTALTLTMSMIMDIREAVVIVPGSTKRDAVTATVLGEISTECPASILRQHDNSVLYLDKDSSEGLR